jgi:D-tyrosyl-tRNA(Tyr) deacylase
MRAVVQRVMSSHVRVADEIIAQIGPGLLVLLGVDRADDRPAADYLADKIANLRIFEDDIGKMNLSLKDIHGEMLVVSQFTLLADCRKGRRPSFVDAAPPEAADPLYRYFVERVRARGVAVRTGRFQALMEVSLVNDGPVTLIVDSPSGGK